MKKQLLLAVMTVILVTGLMLSCKKDETPAAPPAATPTPIDTPTITGTPTATPTATPVVIQWVEFYIFDVHNYGTDSTYAFGAFQVNGLPDTTVGASIVGGGQTLVIPSTGTGDVGGYTSGTYQLNSGVTYSAGQTYTYYASAYGVTSYASVVAPGPVPTLVVDPANGAVTQVRWSAAPGSGYVVVEESAPVTHTWEHDFGAGVTSVDVVYDAGYGGDPYPDGAAGTYQLTVLLQTQETSIVNGVNLLAGCMMEEYYTNPVTLH